MLFKLSTDKTVSGTAAAVQAAVEANHFGVMQVHNLKETMTKKGVEFARECLILEVCQPQQANKLLEQNMSVSTALPCRISIYEVDGKTILAIDPGWDGNFKQVGTPAEEAASGLLTRTT
jgi:uncharacterized protein (DUF302 family)